MKLFETFFARPHRRPGEAHFPQTFEGKGCWWDDPAAIPLAAGRGFNVHLVGESQFQSEIASLVGGRCEEGHNCHVPARLVLAGTERDPDAIGVAINDQPVGWLPWDVAKQVRPGLLELGIGQVPITCKAKIVGGWDRGRHDLGYFGVKLSLAIPIKPHAAARSRTRGRVSSGH